MPVQEEEPTETMPIDPIKALRASAYAEVSATESRIIDQEERAERRKVL